MPFWPTSVANTDIPRKAEELAWHTPHQADHVALPVCEGVVRLGVAEVAVRGHARVHSIGEGLVDGLGAPEVLDELGEQTQARLQTGLAAVSGAYVQELLAAGQT